MLAQKLKLLAMKNARWFRLERAPNSRRQSA
jgi:hypothetical protein